ncbi:MAG TPA: hypothetical protein VM430_13465 [Microbacterium sp.]|nr:hypothetical protein [Microbacterium sp.]
MKGTYYRWTRDADAPARLDADILGSDTSITADTLGGVVLVTVPHRALSPDEARMIGVRLVEAAALAGMTDSVRER